MDNSIEEKLNELLKIKNELDELKNEQRQQQILDDFDKQTKKAKKSYHTFLMITILIMLAGVGGITGNADKYRLNALFIALVGFNSTVLIKLWYWILQSKLDILKEIKHMQIQFSEHLGNCRLEGD
jgi:hypothetical protein